MSPVTVYSKPGCQPCKATERALNASGIEFTKIDISTNPDALDYVRSLGHMSAPVVVTGDKHWSGFKPDMIKSLSA